MATNKVGKVLQIDWEDAWSHSGQWSHAEVQNTEPLIVTLYGYCVRDDKAGVTLAMEAKKDPHTHNYRNIWFVPRAMIRKVKILK